MLYNDLQTASEKSAIVKSVLQSRAVSLIGVFLNRIVHAVFVSLRGQLTGDPFEFVLRLLMRYLGRLLKLNEFLVQQPGEDPERQSASASSSAPVPATAPVPVPVPAAAAAAAEGKSMTAQFLEDTEKWLREDAFRQLVSELQKFTQSDAPFMASFATMFEDMVRTEAKNFWLCLLDDFSVRAVGEGGVAMVMMAIMMT